VASLDRLCCMQIHTMYVCSFTLRMSHQEVLINLNARQTYRGRKIARRQSANARGALLCPTNNDVGEANVPG